MNSTPTIIAPANNIISQLHQIGLRALPAGLDSFLARANEDRWSPQTLLEQLAHAEGLELYRRRMQRRLRVSDIKTFKPMADFDWSWPSKIDRHLIERSLALDFLRENRNLVLVGHEAPEELYMPKPGRSGWRSPGSLI